MGYDFNFTPVFRNFELLLEGALLTLQLSAITMFLGLVLGTLCAAGKVWGPALVRAPVNAYVTAIRNTPFLAVARHPFYARNGGNSWPDHIHGRLRH